MRETALQRGPAVGYGSKELDDRQMEQYVNDDGDDERYIQHIPSFHHNLLNDTVKRGVERRREAVYEADESRRRVGTE